MKWMKRKSDTVEAQQHHAPDPTPDCVHQMTRVLGVYSGILSELNRPKASSAPLGSRENVRA